MKLFHSFFLIFQDAWAFIKDPNARILSGFYHPSGQPISVREAAASGFTAVNNK